MRKKIKKEIKGIIQIMLEAHEHAAFLLQNKRIAEANNILSQCQDCAVHIGESIEKSEGMDTKAVSHLETYCENLFKMSRTIEKKKVTGLKRQLDSGLEQVRYEIEENIPLDRMKIVFMPYKASMWDCMESVWEAADSDEECDAYVVPIPYYERNEQGGAERLCYEGDIFPKEVPITSYEEFSLEAERPDVIYIHNPYDENNYVTSVHPDYYSSRLKEYTDELVYIPYFILYPGEMPEMHRNLASYQNIDKIIVQDETKKESMLDFVPEEKIVVLGSPKVDHILKLGERRQEIIEHEIPKEWRKKIAGKKVILFNVSINGILQNKRYALGKIRYVLSCFENRDDVVLLWRPHPLVEATLKSMRSEMYEEYMSIKKSFIRKGKGIFDETGDAGISAVVADAYLGEYASSMVHYFGVLGKPVMYIDWKVVEDKRKDNDYLSFNTYFRSGNDISFVPLNAGFENQLYRMNLDSGKLEKVMTFPGSVYNIGGAYYGIKRIKNKIVLVPHNAEDIYIYDLDREQGIKIILSESKSKVSTMMFDEAVEYKGELFLLPRCYPAIVKLNLQSLEISEFRECIKPFLLDDTTKQMFNWAFFKKEQYLYLASCNDSRILIFNMQDGNYEIKKIGNYPYGYSRMIYDGQYFWLGGYKTNHIVRWEEDSGEVKEYTYPIEQEPMNEYTYYSSLLDYKDEIIVCYAFSINIVFINKKTGEYRRPKKVEEILNKIQQEFGNELGFGDVRLLNNDTALLLNTGSCSVHVWNIGSNQWKHFPCRFLKNEVLELEKKYIEKYWLSRAVPYSLSEKAVSVFQFLDYIVTWNTDVFKQINDCYYGEECESTIGNKVHKVLKDNKVT